MLVVDTEVGVSGGHSLQGVGEHVLGLVDELLHDQTSEGTAASAGASAAGALSCGVWAMMPKASAAATPARSSAATYTGHCSQLMLPPRICCTSIGPVVRAGLIEAPVVGATGMIAAK